MYTELVPLPSVDAAYGLARKLVQSAVIIAYRCVGISAVGDAGKQTIS